MIGNSSPKTINRSLLFHTSVSKPSGQITQERIPERLPIPDFTRQRYHIPPQDIRLPERLGMDYLPPSHIRLLVVDDDNLVRQTFTMALKDEGYDVDCAASAREAMERLLQQVYDIMICDVFMPGENGLDLLQKSREFYPDMPVVLITAYGSIELARNALSSGASDFITKPCSANDLPIVIERNLTRHACDKKANVQTRIALQSSQENVLSALLTALHTRDTETQGHSERVTAYTMEMAEMLNLSPSDMYHIERGALLHDIGKIGIPDAILLKPGKLTPEEWVEMKKHPEIGYEMCRKINTLQQASQIVLHHHEMWDGGGYPFALKGEEIPLGARLFAVADTLDAMTSNRPYREALPFAVAQEEIKRFSGKQFDPDVVELFLSVPIERWRHIRSLACE